MPMPPWLRLTGDQLYPCLLVLLCVFLGFSRMSSGIDMTDEGILAYGAERVSHGELPNRDFASLQPPLSFYTAAAIYKLFGTSLLSLRIFGFGIYLALPLLIYAIARTMIGPALAFAAALPETILGIPLFNFVPFAPWQGATASATAVLLYLWAVRKNSSLLAGLAGLMTLTAMLCRHDQGVYVAISLVAYTLVLKFAGSLMPKGVAGRVFAGWCAGIVIGALPWTVYWAVEHAIPPMFQQLVVYFATTYVKTNSLPFPHFTSKVSLARNLVVALFYLPPLMGLLAAGWLARQLQARRFALREANMTLILIWTGLFFCQVMGRTDVYHLLITEAPFFILTACVWAMALEGGVNKVVVSTAAALALAVFMALMKPLFLPPEGPLPEAHMERAGVRFQDADEISGLVRWVQQHAPPDKSILCLSYQPLMYFLCERRNPTRWNYLWPGDENAEDQKIFIKQCQNDPPAVVSITDLDTFSHYFPVILTFIQNSYRPVTNLAATTLYLPK